MKPEQFALVVSQCFTLTIATLGWFTIDRFTRRREREAWRRRVIDEYCARAEKAQSDDFARHGLLQRLGAAEFSRKELDWLCQRIAARGFPDPRRFELPEFADRRKTLHGLLQWGAREAINLADGEALMRRHAQEADDWVNGRRRHKP